MTHAERAEYLRALAAGAQPSGPTTSARSGRASPACSTRSRSAPGMARRRRRLRVLRRPGRHLPVRGAGAADGRRRVRAARPRAGRRRRRDHPVERAARRSSRTRSRPRCSPAAPSCSSRRPRRPARATCRRGRRGRSGCRPACSTSSPPTARSPSCSCATRASTRSPSPARPRPAGGSRRSAASASPAARSSSAASRPRSILDDTDLGAARPSTLAERRVLPDRQVCSSLTRIVVTRKRHDELVEALAATFSQVQVGDPFDERARRWARWPMRAPARPRRGLHRQGHRRGRDARHRRRPPEAPRPRLVRRADRVRQRRQLARRSPRRRSSARC